jgi:hypothetical protein
METGHDLPMMIHGDFINARRVYKLSQLPVPRIASFTKTIPTNQKKSPQFYRNITGRRKIGKVPRYGYFWAGRRRGSRQTLPWS